jgi:hypothetical protein
LSQQVALNLQDQPLEFGISNGHVGQSSMVVCTWMSYIAQVQPPAQRAASQQVVKVPCALFPAGQAHAFRFGFFSVSSVASVKPFRQNEWLKKSRRGQSLRLRCGTSAAAGREASSACGDSALTLRPVTLSPFAQIFTTLHRINARFVLVRLSAVGGAHPCKQRRPGSHHHLLSSGRIYESPTTRTSDPTRPPPKRSAPANG